PPTFGRGHGIRCQIVWTIRVFRARSQTGASRESPGPKVFQHCTPQPEDESIGVAPPPIEAVLPLLTSSAYRGKLPVPGIEEGRRISALARHYQFGIELSAAVDAKQSVLELIFLEERPAQDPAQPLPERPTVNRRRMNTNVVEAADIEKRLKIGTGKSVFVGQGHVQTRSCARSLHIWGPQQQNAAASEGPVESVHHPKQGILGHVLDHVRHEYEVVLLRPASQKISYV